MPLTNLLHQTGKFLFESAEQIDLGKLLAAEKLPIVIACHSKQMRESLNQQAEKLDGNAVKFIDSPEDYLSEEKLKTFLAKKSFTDSETAFLVKILLWKEQSKDLNRREISLFGEEYKLWPLVAREACAMSFRAPTSCRVEKSRFLDSPSSPRYGGSLETTTKTNTPAIICIPHRLLITDSIETISPAALIVEEALSLEESLTAALQKKFALDCFEPLIRILTEESEDRKADTKGISNTLEILFGLIGMYYENFQGEMTQDIILDENFISSLEGRKISDTINNLKLRWEELKKKFEKGKTELAANVIAVLDVKIRDFSKIFELTSWQKTGWAAWIGYFAGKLSVSSAPLFIGGYLQESFSADCVILKDCALSLQTDFSFIKSTLSLDGRWQEFAEKSPLKNISLEIPQDLPEPGGEGYFKACESILKAKMNEGGNLLAIFNSKKAVAAFYSSLLQDAAQKMLAIFAQGVTGGTAKIVELFMENPENSLLFGLPSIMAFLEKIGDFVKRIVFQKLPFDFSYSPLGKLRPQAFPNGFEKYTLQKALIRFKHFLYKCGIEAKNGKKQIIVLDSRLLKREYGKKLMEEILN